MTTTQNYEQSRAEFELICGPDLLESQGQYALTRSYVDEEYTYLATKFAWKAWQASRANTVVSSAGAVPIEDRDYSMYDTDDAFTKSFVKNLKRADTIDDLKDALKSVRAAWKADVDKLNEQIIALSTPPAPEEDDTPLREGIEILDNLIASIQKHGNYSPESTVNFLNHCRQCLSEAAPKDDQAEAVPSEIMVLLNELAEHAPKEIAGYIHQPTQFKIFAKQAKELLARHASGSKT